MRYDMSKEQPLTHLGALIKRRRKVLDMPRSVLARQADLLLETLERAELGRITLTDRVIGRLAQVLEIRATDLHDAQNEGDL